MKNLRMFNNHFCKILHPRKGKNIILRADDILTEVKKQIADGVEPHYHTKGIDLAGWLMWSTYHDGAGVAFIREDKQVIIVTGWQGEFSYK